MVSSDPFPRRDGLATPARGAVLAGRYRLDDPLGPSDLGQLWRAEDLLLGRSVMVRRFPQALVDEELERRLELRLHPARRSRDEQTALADILDLLDVGRDAAGRLFVVTDAHPGESLADELAERGPPTWPRLRALAVRACQIVHLSHEQGIIRQDLRTAGLYPLRDKADPGTLKILSPGLLIPGGARVWSCADPQVALALARYAAPEQIAGGVIDRRTDVYALGVILYECLTGQVPFPDPRPAHVLAAHLVQPPPPFPPAVRRRGIAPELEAIVARALAKAPDDRWPTVMALANAIAAIELGRCDASGVLETAAVAELLEPPRSDTSMRVHARLAGGAGLAPAPAPAPVQGASASDPAATGEHVWRDILDAAESTSGLRRIDAGDAASSDSAITRVAVPDDSAPTLPYGIAGESASRWPGRAPDDPPPAARPARRIVPWLVAGGLALATSGVVSFALRPQSPAAPAAPREIAPSAPARTREIAQPTPVTTRETAPPASVTTRETAPPTPAAATPPADIEASRPQDSVAPAPDPVPGAPLPDGSAPASPGSDARLPDASAPAHPAVAPLPDGSAPAHPPSSEDAPGTSPSAPDSAPTEPVPGDASTRAGAPSPTPAAPRSARKAGASRPPAEKDEPPPLLGVGKSPPADGPASTRPDPSPRKTPPGSRLPDREGLELPDPAAPLPTG